MQADGSINFAPTSKERTESELGMAEPALMGEILPRLLDVAGLPGAHALVGRAIGQLAATPEGLRGIALGVLRDSRITDPSVTQYLVLFLAGQPALKGLLAVDGQESPGRELSGHELARIEHLRPLLQKLLNANTRFQCANCGYGSDAMHWQCPGCRSWESNRPVDSKVLEGVLS